MHQRTDEWCIRGQVRDASKDRSVMHQRTGEGCIRGQVRDASKDRWVMHQRTAEGCIRGQLRDASKDRWLMHHRTGEGCIKGQMTDASEDRWGMHQRTDDWCIRGQVSDASNNRLWHAVRVSVVTGLFVLQYYLWLELMMNHYGCHRWRQNVVHLSILHLKYNAYVVNGLSHMFPSNWTLSAIIRWMDICIWLTNKIICQVSMLCVHWQCQTYWGG